MPQYQPWQFALISSIVAATQKPKEQPVDVLGILALAAAMGSGPKQPITPEKRERLRLRAMTLAQYAEIHFLPEKNHATTSATAELTRAALKRLGEFSGRDVAMHEISPGLIRDFRNWMARKIASGATYGPATANKHLRQLRAVLGHAAKNRIIRPLPPIAFLEEAEPDVQAWEPAELAKIENQARAQEGMVGDVPAAVFWTAWSLVAQKIGCRITAQMLTRRQDYDPAERCLLLRKSTQKQKKDQRIALPPRAAEAVERLLAAHDHETIWGSWPYDPPLASGRRKWKVLAKHFEEKLVKPAGLSLKKGVKTRQFRRTAATIVEELGGNPQELLGHASRRTTDLYLSKDPRRRKICRQSLLIPDGGGQKLLF